MMWRRHCLSATFTLIRPTLDRLRLTTYPQLTYLPIIKLTRQFGRTQFVHCSGIRAKTSPLTVTRLR